MLMFNVFFNVISKLIKKINIRPLVLIMPIMSGYVKTFKVEDKINILMSLRIDDEKLLEKYKAIWTIIKD